MRACPSSWLLIIDILDRILSFRFTHNSDVLASRSYRVTPGDGVEDDESFEQAAIEEFREETGTICQDIGTSAVERASQMLLPSDEVALTQERFFTVRINDEEISTGARSDHERPIINDYYWWTPDELEKTTDAIFPENIPTIFSESEKTRR